MYIAYKKVNGYTVSNNTDRQCLLYRRGVSAPTILVVNGVTGGTSNLRGCLVHRRMQPRHSCGAPHIFKQLFGRQLNLGQPHENAGISPFNASLQCSAQLL